jgi:non-canonical purine NTP pyrophosphatase (RdgB/HAM1 family)
MKTVHFATSNSWKFIEARGYLKKKGLSLEQFKVDYHEPREEDGVKIAKLKVRSAFRKLQKPLFVWDGSLYVKALKDFPKSYVKLFDEYLGAGGLIKLLEGERNRNWEIANILFYKDKEREKCFIGIIKGRVANKITHGHKGVIRDFDRVLIPKGYDKTYAEFSENEWEKYNQGIWRPSVFDNFINWFKSLKS